MPHSNIRLIDTRDNKPMYECHGCDNAQVCFEAAVDFLTEYLGYAPHYICATEVDNEVEDARDYFLDNDGGKVAYIETWRTN